MEVCRNARYTSFVFFKKFLIIPENYGSPVNSSGVMHKF